MPKEKKRPLTLVATGDISPNRDDPPSIFRFCGDVFKKADIVFGQLESPMSEKGSPAFNLGTSNVLPSKSITSLTEEGAGFDVMSFAGNHAMHYGWEAFVDTLDSLDKVKIDVVGAGRDIHEARQPAIVERDGTKVGFLGYLSIVFPGLIADEEVPGCVPLRSYHYYRQVDFQPGTPPLIVTNLYPDDKEAMLEDIRKLRPKVDVLVVSMHCGVHSVPAVIAMYQKEAAYAAIDAGADLVLQHHAHILKGIEVYKGKVIFYGMGNFAVEHMQPYPCLPGRKAKRPWKRDANSADFVSREFYKVKKVPGYEKHNFLFDGLKTMIVKAYIEDKKIQKVTYIPAYITPDLEPEVVTRENPKAQEVFDYVSKITESEDLKASFSWQGDEVLVSEKAASHAK